MGASSPHNTVQIQRALSLHSIWLHGFGEWHKTEERAAQEKYLTILFFARWQNQTRRESRRKTAMFLMMLLSIQSCVLFMIWHLTPMANLLFFFSVVWQKCIYFLSFFLCNICLLFDLRPTRQWQYRYICAS